MKILSKSNKTLKFLALILAIGFFGFSALKLIQNAKAIRATDFDAGRIIDDDIFYNKNSMSVSDIQNFLNRQIGTCDTWGTQRASDKGRPDLTNAQYDKQTWGV